MFAGFQRRATDALFPSAPSDARVVVVGIDGKTIVKYGYPFPRDLYVDLVSKPGRLRRTGDRVRRDFSSEPRRPGRGRCPVRGRDRRGRPVVLGTQATELKAGKPAPVAISLDGYAKGLQDANFTSGPRAGQRRPERCHQPERPADRGGSPMASSCPVSRSPRSWSTAGSTARHRAPRRCADRESIHPDQRRAIRCCSTSRRGSRTRRV